MSITTYQHHLFTNSPPRITLLFSSNSLSLRNLSLSRHVTTSLHSSNFHFKPQTRKNSFSFTLKAYQSGPTIRSQVSNQFSIDQFLSIAELLCIISSSIVTISYALNCTFSKRGALGVIGSNTGFAWGMVGMVSGVVIGAWIRRRQWWRICRETGREGGRESLNLAGRIEKLEEDMRSSATIIRVLSRQLEKLGIRFRVTRKVLKEPIVETAALAKKNSEATRALALQENILEKELGEMQKILLAMQEQQQKQLELILAIGKSGKLWDNRQEPVQDQELIKTSDLTEGVKKLETHETQPSVASKGSNNDRPWKKQQ
ncbi:TRANSMEMBRANE PROTEIN [Salix purpurea]|uniref:TRANSMEMBRANE PROTEIN n=1 Tax=Salix purpurea TaxID=77065 RepID=A0A9Q0WX30_SALPP|nr:TRANSMEMBRANE PROTEIN [Salix purpurea]